MKAKVVVAYVYPLLFYFPGTSFLFVIPAISGVFDKSRFSGLLRDLTDIDTTLSDAYRQEELSAFEESGGLERVFLRKHYGIA